jgi:hypothetical protein
LFVVVLFVLASALPVLAEAATLRLSPNTGVYQSGATFTTQVIVNTAGDSINAAEGTISFDPAQLSVVRVTKGPIFSLWAVEPSYSNSAGTITFGGGSPSGYTGSNGTALSVTFRTKGAGTARVNFQNASVLAADGRGTNVLTNMTGGTYTVSAANEAPEPEVIVEYVPAANTPAAPVIQSDTHPDPAGWHTATSASLSWEVPSDVTAVRTLLSAAPSAVPQVVYNPPISSIELADLDSGEQYFHLQFQNSDGWGGVTSYRLAIDTEGPSEFVLALPDEADYTSPTQTIGLAGTDAGSGIVRYLVQLDGADPYEYSDEDDDQTLTLTELTPGYHTVIVEAFDAAGNSRVATIAFTILAFDQPQFTEYPTKINEDVIPVIQGVTRPGAEVVVTITKQNAASDPDTYTVTSGADGIFTVIPDGTFTTGVYELTAVATDQYGAMSDPSESVRFVVEQPGYVQIGNVVLGIMSLAVPLLGLMFLLALLVVWFLARLNRVRRFVTRETGEALQVVEAQFATIDRTLNREAEALAAARKGKKLTKAETELLTQMQNALATAKTKIQTEVGEVDDAVSKPPKRKTRRKKRRI